MSRLKQKSDHASPKTRTDEISLAFDGPSESLLFLKQWYKNPAQLGTIAPISKRLAEKAAACIQNPQEKCIVEIGAGPGRLTQALIKAGVNPHNFKAVELDPHLCAFAKKNMPHIDFIEGDAQHLSSLLPADWIKKVDVVFSTIPFMYLSKDMRTRITEAAFSVMKPQGEFFHLTYHYGSPLSHMLLSQEKIASLWWNLPPAFIWRYTHPLSTHHQIPLKSSQSFQAVS